MTLVLNLIPDISFTYSLYLTSKFQGNFCTIILYPCPKDITYYYSKYSLLKLSLTHEHSMWTVHGHYILLSIMMLHNWMNSEHAESDPVNPRIKRVQLACKASNSRQFNGRVLTSCRATRYNFAWHIVLIRNLINVISTGGRNGIMWDFTSVLCVHRILMLKNKLA